MLLLLSTLVFADSGRAYHVRLARAESLYVAEIGVGRPVVLIPGLFGAAYGFRHLISRLVDDGYRAIVVEPLGIGNSARPRRADYSQSAQADRVSAVLEQMGVRGAIVVGHSAAASIAFRMAYRRPDLVSGVVSIDAGVVDGASTGMRRYAMFAPWIKWLGGAKLIRKKIRQALLESSADTTWITDEVVAGYTAGAATDLDGTLLAFLAMASAREPEKLKTRLKDIHVPVRLLLGGAKHAAGATAEDISLLRHSIPVFAVDTVPGVGHYIQEERPEAVLAAVRRASRDR